MDTRQHTLDQKKAASELLFYEVTMLHDLSCRMETLLQEDTILGTAFLEVFSIHTKVLHDFFYSDNQPAEAVIAQDFFESSGEWSRARNPESELLKLAAQRIGDHVGRFTYARREVVPLLKGWDYCKIAKEIESVFIKFVEAAPVKYLGPHCSEFKHQEEHL